MVSHNGNNTKANKGQRQFQPLPRNNISKKGKKKKNKSQTPTSNHIPLVRETPAIIRLHKEIEAFYQEAKPTPLEHSIRQDVVDRLTVLVHQCWPYAKVETFGSFKTGLYLPTGDIDVVIFGRWRSLPLRSFEQLLTRSNFPQPGSLKVLDQASVPIIKLVDRTTNIKVDICFNLPGGISCADFINEHTQKYPSLPRLAMVLKQFLCQRGLGEVYHGGLSSFSLILMVVSLLQLSPLRSATNYAVLLMEFLRLYGLQFNYQKAGIDVSGKGSYYPRPDNNPQNPLHIQDPFYGRSHNVGQSSYGALTVKKSFEQAYVLISRILNSQEPLQQDERILEKIAKLPDTSRHFRNFLARVFRHPPNSAAPPPLP